MQLFWSALGQGTQCLGWAVLAIASIPLAVQAHGAHVQARSANAVEIQAAYDTGEPMVEASVQVFAPDNPQTPVQSGLTDAEGRFVFVPTTAGTWEVSVRQAGHGDIVAIPVEMAGTVASEFTNDAGLNWLQRGVVVGAVTWGCVGTALYFGRRGKQ